MWGVSRLIKGSYSDGSLEENDLLYYEKNKRPVGLDNGNQRTSKLKHGDL